MKMNLKVVVVVLIGIVITLNGCAINKNFSSENGVTSEEIVVSEISEYVDTDDEGILVKVYVNSEGVVYGFEVSGHADYAEYGSDIVASAISTIAQNAVFSLDVYTNDETEIEIEEEYLKCILPNVKDGRGSREACVLLKSAIVGFYTIGNSYDEYINVYKITEN